MAAGSFAEPGKVINGEEIGPCVDEQCGHIDCTDTRKKAAMRCEICGEPIGYETLFYNIRPKVFVSGQDEFHPVHARCYE